MNLFNPLVPLLIPSFSSKGNLFILNEEGQYISDNYDLAQALDIRISKSYLLSAYDIYYGFMPREPSDWPYTEHLFIDSGGYETNDSFDLSERNKYNYKVLPWDYKKMETVYERIVACPKFENSNIILSAFDGKGAFKQQLHAALDLKKDFPTAFTNFIIKIDFGIDDLLKELKQHREQLTQFSILGFTEKELGLSLRERLLNIIDIRQQLDGCGWNGYVHIFGGLEPNFVKLFYYAGADIFDGLSWQRTRYWNNSTLFTPEKYIVSSSEFENKYLMMLDNLAYMQEISNTLSTIAGKRTEYAITLKKLLRKKSCIYIQDLLRELEV